MAIVVGIRFKNSGKIYYFDPIEFLFEDGDGAILDTVRGIEFGDVVFGNKEVPNKDIVQPLKPVLRKATAEDIRQNHENLGKRDYLISVSNEKVQTHKLVMKIVDAEYTFDRSKVIIYFTAEGRIDFRDLVRDLASVFRVRIELRQIYERDDIKMRGALAACGRPCCCGQHLQDFEKVSIKMAKIQGLSLNPQKISGCCGKLMCCLKYENQFYIDTIKKMPKVGSCCKCKDGDGLVVSNDVLREQVKLKVIGEDGSYEYKIYELKEIHASEIQQIPNDDEVSDNDEQQ